MRTPMLTAFALTALSFADPATAQDRWAFELRGGVAMPTQDIADDLDTGFGFEGAFGYRFMPHLAAYAGWDWMRFTSEASALGGDLDFEETGYAFGLRFQHPFTEGGPTAWWLRGGGTYDHLELENADGDPVGDSGHELGFEVGGGLAFQAGRGWSVTPGVRYRSLSVDVETPSATAELDLTYLTLGVGVVWTF